MENRTSMLAVLAIAAAMGAALGCRAASSDGDADSDTDVDSDGDGDGDAGTDGDVDGDGDADSDSDSDVDEDPCAAYPCAPYGTAVGSVIEDLSFEAANDAARGLAGDDGQLDLHDLYQANVDHGGALTGVLIWHTTGWCPYCAGEAPHLEGMYQALLDAGVLLVGAVAETNTPGQPATAEFAASYASRYEWTFPAVAGGFENRFWPPAEVASGEIGVPLHVFIDLRTMRIYGRFSGATQEMRLPSYVLQALAEGPEWGPSGERVFDFDCAPGTGTETEPNGLDDTPEDGSSLPFTMTGAFCPPTIAEGFFVDEDVVDLGTLSAGDVIDVQLSAPDGSLAYPTAQLARLSGSTLEPLTYGPVDFGGDGGRQWVIEASGHYLVAAIDGRIMAASLYGEDVTVPEEDQCCAGGPDYTYEVHVDQFDLAPTGPALAMGDNAAAFETGDVGVFSLDVTSGTTYQIRMIADDDQLDPYLVLYDPATGTVLGSNDDESYPSNINSYISYRATTTGTIYVVAEYWGIWFRSGSPGYVIRVQ